MMRMVRVWAIQRADLIIRFLVGIWWVEEKLKKRNYY